MTRVSGVHFLFSFFGLLWFFFLELIKYFRIGISSHLPIYGYPFFSPCKWSQKGKNQIYDFPRNTPNTSADPMVPWYPVLYVWSLSICIMTYRKAVQVRNHLCWSQKFHLVFASPCCSLDSAIHNCLRKKRKNTGFWQKIESLSQLFCGTFPSFFPYSCYLFSSCWQ